MKIKKYVAILLIINAFIFSLSTSMAHASNDVSTYSLGTVSKPLTITAKKAAKEVATNTAVEMANQIVSEYLVRELIEGVSVDDGYNAVCMDGAKDNVKECKPEKRAQIKKLTEADKKLLEEKVETVLEKKTNTSSKWAKFLDWFIPIFLVSGLVDFVSTAITDGDILSFFDEIAQEALIESNLLKPLVAEFDIDNEMLDFAEFVDSVSITTSSDWINVKYTLNAVLKPNKTITFTHVSNTSGAINTVNASTAFSATIPFVKSGTRASDLLFYPNVFISNVIAINSTNYNVGGSSENLYVGTTGYDTFAQAGEDSGQWIENNIKPLFSNVNDINAVMNAFVNAMNLNSAVKWEFTNVKTYNPPSTNVDTDYGNQSSIDKIKGEDGLFQLPGMNDFDYTYNGKDIYPDVDGTWKDKVTGETVEVNEDEITVNDKGEAGTDGETGTDDKEEGNGETCEEGLNLPSFKPISEAFTTSFPFSIPWDIKRAIDSAFGDIGDEKPSFKLTFLGDVELTIPDYIDNWMPFVRGILVFLFDVTIMFLFYRFMKGGAD